MALCSITGTLKRKIITDITIGFAAGFGLAYLYWEVEHKPIIAKRCLLRSIKQKEIEEGA